MSKIATLLNKALITSLIGLGLTGCAVAHPYDGRGAYGYGGYVSYGPAPVYVRPPVYMAPQPVYVQPAPVYVPPVVIAPLAGTVTWGYGGGGHHHHHGPWRGGW